MPGFSAESAGVRPCGGSAALLLPLLAILLLPAPVLPAAADGGAGDGAERSVTISAPVAAEEDPVAASALFWQTTVRAWMRALEASTARRKGSPEIRLGLLTRDERQGMAALITEAILPTPRLFALSPGQEPAIPRETRVTVRMRQDAERMVMAALAQGAPLQAWTRLIREANHAVWTLAIRNDIAPVRRAALRTLHALLFPLRNALERGGNGWMTDVSSLADLERAVRDAPGSALARVLLAEASLRSDLPQQAIDAAGHALRLDPELSHARYIRALAHWRLHQLALAEDDLDGALAQYARRRSSGFGAREAAHRQERHWLRARGAVRMMRRNHAGMCEDFVAACELGDCDGLRAMREQSLCMPAAAEEPAAVAEAAPPETPPAEASVAAASAPEPADAPPPAAEPSPVGQAAGVAGDSAAPPAVAEVAEVAEDAPAARDAPMAPPSGDPAADRAVAEAGMAASAADPAESAEDGPDMSEWDGERPLEIDAVPDGRPDSAPAETPAPSAPLVAAAAPAVSPDAGDVRGDPPLWPPVDAAAAAAMGRLIPACVLPLPDPFLFPRRPMR